MQTKAEITLSEVKDVYNGPEGDLWELIMGEQIHIGGFQASRELASLAGISAGMKGVDFCCCNGAGMRFLRQFCGVDSMVGVDATEKVVESGRQRCVEQGMANRISFALKDVCDCGLDDDAFDFVWGQDAWCYVTDKAKLIEEAVRVVKPGGTIAFTDWLEGEAGLTESEGDRFLSFMKFPNVLTLDEYLVLLRDCGCEVVVAEDTGLFHEYTCLYLEMLDKQLTYDALRIIGFDIDMLGQIREEMVALRDLAQASKVIQGRIVARKGD